MNNAESGSGAPLAWGLPEEEDFLMMHGTILHAAPGDV